jgi:hypothetical protein
LGKSITTAVDGTGPRARRLLSGYVLRDGEAAMARTIDQFMWGYQHIFRSSADRLLREALQGVHAAVDAELLLVGFRARGRPAQWPVCIEPEDGPYHPDQLADVPVEGDRLYQADPERQLRHSHPRVHEERQRILRNKSRAAALQQRLAQLDRSHDFEVGQSVRVGEYDVHPVVRIAEWSAVRRLRTGEYDRQPVVTSVPDGVVREVLRLCEQALLKPDPGAELYALGAEAQDIQRVAARELVRSAALLTGEVFSHRLSEDLTAIANLQYEGATALGEMVLAQRGHSMVTERIVLQEGVPLRQHRAVRKLFELARGRLCLLSDSEVVYGLGRYKSPPLDGPEDLFVVRIPGAGTWELHHGTLPLLRVTHGTATLPVERLTRSDLDELAHRRLAPFVQSVDTDALWNLLHRATSQVKGAMIIVSTAAAAEAARLQPQATRVQPVQLDAALLADATNIDGGVLLDPLGHCHAIGVILDGTARGQGDPSRGSRYNSALRYLEGEPPACVILIVSADGMVNMLPALRPRVTRAEVAQALEHVLAQALPDRPNLERFSKAWERLKALSFYLNADQVDQANSAFSRVDEYRRRSSTVRIIESPLVVQADMNDEYFRDED